jgi:hypothetical protein
MKIITTRMVSTGKTILDSARRIAIQMMCPSRLFQLLRRKKRI